MPARIPPDVRAPARTRRRAAWSLVAVAVAAAWLPSGASSPGGARLASSIAAERDAAGGRPPRRTRPDGAGEYEQKADYLLYFARFTTWPETAFSSPKAPIVVGVAGRDPFGRVLDERVAGQRVGRRPVVVQRLERPERASDVHILFVGGMSAKERAALLKRTAGRSVLVTADFAGFARRGGVAGFFVDEGRVRFEINPEAAARRSLRFSSQLLKLARIVEEEGQR